MIDTQVIRDSSQFFLCRRFLVFLNQLVNIFEQTGIELVQRQFRRFFFRLRLRIFRCGQFIESGHAKGSFALRTNDRLTQFSDGDAQPGLTLRTVHLNFRFTGQMSCSFFAISTFAFSIAIFGKIWQGKWVQILFHRSVSLHSSKIEPTDVLKTWRKGIMVFKSRLRTSRMSLRKSNEIA